MENEINNIESLAIAERSPDLIANFVEGFAAGWFMAVKESFKMELNIEYTERKKDKISYFEWTQGPYFKFSEGQVIYDSKSAYTCWENALKNVNLACQIISAKQNIPFKYKNEETGKTEFRVIEGYVQFQLFRPDDARNKLVPYAEHTLSQNDFVEFLKTGEIKGEVCL